MVDLYLRHLKKKLSLSQKRLDLETLLRDYSVDLNEPTDTNNRQLLHLLIQDEATDLLELVLSLPKEGYQTKVKADRNIIDSKTGWTPLVACINQGPQGYIEGVNLLLRAGADIKIECEELNFV